MLQQTKAGDVAASDCHQAEPAKPVLRQERKGEVVRDLVLVQLGGYLGVDLLSKKRRRDLLEQVTDWCRSDFVD